MFPASFYQHLLQVNHTGIRAGAQRQQFTPIWVVQAGGRVFARSWTQSPTGWFATLLQEGSGHVQYGSTVLAVRAVPVPATDEAMQKAIDAAYRHRYTSPENIPYVEGITQPAFWHYTAELLLQADHATKALLH